MKQQISNSENSWLDDKDNYLSIEATLHPQQAKQILLRGKFRLPRARNGVPEEGTHVFKHIVLVATRLTNYQALTPYTDVVVFDDDIKQEENNFSGFFNVNVMDHLRFNGEGDYYLMCSIGTYTSNIVKVSVV